MSEEKETPEEIRLTMKNRTKLDLIFRYNEIEYPIKAKGIHSATVEPGHHISVRDPNHTRVTRNKITVEPDYFVSVLERDITIDCELVGWQLQLRLGINVI
jgi:hypothetical protein